MSAERKIIAGFAIAILLLCLVGIAAYTNMQEYIETEAWQVHAYEVLHHAENLLARVQQAESSERSYFLTEDTLYLREYAGALRIAALELAIIDSLVRRDPGHYSIASRIRTLYQARVALFAGRVALFERAGLAAAIASVKEGSGQRAMDSLRAAIRDLETAEHTLLRFRATSARDAARQAFFIIVLGSLSALVFVGTSGALFVRELRQRRKTAELLRASDERYALALEGTNDGIWDWDLTGGAVYYSPRWKKILGYTDDEITNTAAEWKARVHPDDRDRVAEELEAHLEGRTPIYECEYRLRHKDGTYRWVLARGCAKRDAGGHPTRMAGSHTDITERRAAEEEVQRTKNLLNSIIENIPHMVFLKHAGDLRFARFNHAGVELLGLREEELLGKNDYDFFPTAEADFFTRKDREVLAGTGILDIPEEPIQTRNKGVRILHTKKIALRDERGKPLYLLGISEDITEYKAAEEALRAYAAEVTDLYNNAPCGYHSIDAGGVFMKINDTELRWLGYTQEEIVGKKSVTDILTAESRRLFQVSFPRFKERGWVQDLELELIRKDGTTFPVIVGATAIYDENGEYVSSRSTVFDNTLRKRAEEQVMKLNSTLARRAVELEAVNKELEAFSYSVSHDLRSPLRAIDGFSKVLLSDYADVLDNQARDYLLRVRAASQRMAQLIDDLLKLSRITRVELRPQTIDLSALAAESLRELQAGDPTRPIALSIASGVTGFGDAHLLRNAMDNLLGNAWKYTRNCSQARIEFGTLLRNGTTVYYVRDNGAGFDMKYAAKLFGAFQRLHTQSEFEGNGIGLATVQRIIHRHGGRVWAEAATNEGATFYFTLSEKGTQVS